MWSYYVMSDICHINIWSLWHQSWSFDFRMGLFCRLPVRWWSFVETLWAMILMIQLLGEVVMINQDDEIWWHHYYTGFDDTSILVCYVGMFRWFEIISMEQWSHFNGTLNNNFGKVGGSFGFFWVQIPWVWGAEAGQVVHLLWRLASYG
jgi:hypothetical protein